MQRLGGLQASGRAMVLSSSNNARTGAAPRRCAVDLLLRGHSSAAAAPAPRAAPHVIEAQPSSTAAQRSTQEEPPAASVYVHLPFCKRKCFYCDFPVEAVGGRPASSRPLDRMRTYVDLLLREVAATPREAGAPLQTIYFGGGTPSLLPPEQLGRILEALDQRYGLAAGAEVSMEADPGTFDLPRIRQYLALGVTRLSVGVQSFQQELLTKCGRAHTLDDVYRALDVVRAAGVPTWSLDLISGLPYLTRDMWLHSLEQAVQASPTHVSVYDLQVEEGTPFARWYAPGTKPLPEDEDAAAMYMDASRVLGAAGYEHYEISNYARPGHRSRHNQVYWAGAPYLAFGMGAASFAGGRRFTRPGQMKPYEAWVRDLEAGATQAGAPQLPGSALPPQSQEERMLDTIMLRLRTADGLDLGAFEAAYGADMTARVQRSLRKHVASGLVLAAGSRAAGQQAAGQGRGQQQQLERSGDASVLRLADPQGFLLSNEIISDVFAAVSGS